MHCTKPRENKLYQTGLIQKCEQLNTEKQTLNIKCKIFKNYKKQSL